MSFCAAAYIDTTSEPCIVNWYWLFDWRPPIWIAGGIDGYAVTPGTRASFPRSSFTTS